MKMIHSNWDTIILLLVLFLVSQYGISYATGDSMLPTIPNGTILIVKKTKTVDIGDIVVYKMDNRAIAHRIVSKYDDNGVMLFFAQGDNNEVIDRLPIYRENIVGKVLFYE